MLDTRDGVWWRLEFPSSDTEPWSNLLAQTRHRLERSVRLLQIRDSKDMVVTSRRPQKAQGEMARRGVSLRVRNGPIWVSSERRERFGTRRRNDDGSYTDARRQDGSDRRGR